MDNSSRKYVWQEDVSELGRVENTKWWVMG